MLTVPQQPSPEAVAELRRAEQGAQRKSLAGLGPRGFRSAVAKAVVRGIDAALRPPRTTEVRRLTDPPGWWVAAVGADEAKGAVLHLHGGAFVLPPIHRAAAAEMSARTGLPVLLSRHRRPPAHPFPAAADDALALYRYLLDRGIPASKVRLTGDSSGGFLALALLGDLQRAGLPLPAAVYLTSPLVDLSGESVTRRDEESPDPVTPPEMVVRTNKAYAGTTALTDPRLDVLAADPRGWPPILIQVGETECLTAENRALADRVTAAGGQCELQVWPAQTHGFPVKVLKQVPEANAALDYAAEFLTR